MTFEERFREERIAKMRYGSTYIPHVKTKNNVYVVWKGRTLGLFDNWAEVRRSTDGFPKTRFCGFETYEQAIYAWEMFETSGKIPTIAGVRRIKQDTESFRKVKLTLEQKRAKRAFMKALKSRSEFVVKNFPGKNGAGSRLVKCPLAKCHYPQCKC